MKTQNSEPCDSTGVEIRTDYYVRVTNNRFHLYGHMGKVVDTNSPLFGGSLGPIAVFFDEEVPNQLLLNDRGANLCTGKCSTPPTPTLCKNCPRIVCFHPGVLTVIS